MKKRIFIAINLPEEIKKELSSFQMKWPELPCRWTKKENIHITLIFLGYVSDNEILEIIETTKKVVLKNSSFLINLNKICYGPPKKLPPRMVWVEGEKVKELTDLKNSLEKSLLDSGVRFIPENRDFHPHITLARIKEWEWRKMDSEEIPEINQDISLTFNVNSIEIMESELKLKGPEYTIIESVKFKN